MGGPGSGRRSYNNAKRTTNEHQSIDIRRWHREGLLRPNTFFYWEWRRYGKVNAYISARVEPRKLTLTYRQKQADGNWRFVSHPVHIDHSTCNYGGQRPWFICPTNGCGRRVAILYWAETFACRDCHNLAYQCQREVFDDRATRRVEKIRSKLGWEPGIFGLDGFKPKGMHEITYLRLMIQHDYFLRRSLAGIAKRLNLQSDIATSTIMRGLNEYSV